VKEQPHPLKTAVGQPLPQVYIVMECKLRDFIADQNRIAHLKCDWLYKLCSPHGRAKMIREAGFTPVMPTERRSTPATRLGA
jgi:hypothetical protein